MGEVINDDSLLDIVLEGLTGDYLQLKYNAEADDSFTLDKAIYTIRNMHANGIAEHGPSRKQKGRQSAMVTVFNKGSACLQQSWPLSQRLLPPKKIIKETNEASTKWCSLNKAHLHDNSECRSQQQQLNGNNRNNRNNRNGRTLLKQRYMGAATTVGAVSYTHLTLPTTPYV